LAGPRHRNPVLSDHRKVGNRYIPPFADIGPLNEVSWARNILPEIIWIALFHDAIGHQGGVQLALALARTTCEVTDSEAERDSYLISGFSKLTPQQLSEIVDALNVRVEISAMRDALRTLVALYPECPLKFLYSQPPMATDVTPDQLEDFKRVVANLIPRGNRSATLAQTTAVFIAEMTGSYARSSNVAPLNFEAIVDYPATEESRSSASMIRATITGLVGFRMSGDVWSEYFWTQGLRVDKCQFWSPYDGDE